MMKIPYLGEAAAKNIGKSIQITTTIFVLTSIIIIFSTYIYASAFTFTFIFPDTFTLWESYLRNGYFGSIYFYWNELIGRVSAISFATLEVMLIHTFAPSPWQGIVFFRIVNNLMICAAIYYSFRMFSPTTPRLLLAGIALFAFSASDTLSVSNVTFATLDTWPNVKGVNAVTGIWLLDQSIYFVMTASYFIVFAYLWRYVTEGLKSIGLWLFLFYFIVFLNSHELALVVGGLIYFVMLMSTLYQRAGHSTKSQPFQTPPQDSSNVQGTWLSGSSFSIVAIFGIVYAVSASIRIFSPSLASQNKVWPVSKPIFPDSFEIGFAAGWSTFERLVDLSTPVMPILFVVCLAAGIAFRRDDIIRGRRMVLLFIFLAIFFLASFSFAMSTLDASTNRLRWDAFPVHQHLPTSFMGAFCTGMVGLLLGSLFPSGATRRGLFNLVSWTFLAAGAAVIYFSPQFDEIVTYLRGNGELRQDGGSWSNQIKEFARFDQQLRDLDADGKAYADELSLFTPDPAYPQNYTSFYHPPAWRGLGPMYGLSEIVYLPCELAPKNNCTSPGLQEELEFGDGGALKGTWRRPSNVAVSYGTGSMTITETPNNGEHYLLGGPFDKGERTIVHAEVEILNRKNVDYFALYLMSADGTAIQMFNLKKKRPFRRGEYGARASQAKITETGDGVLLLSVTFSVIGPSPTFELRFQMLASFSGLLNADATNYAGDAERLVEIGKVRLHKKMYELSEIAYLSCELERKNRICNGKGKRPRHQELVFEDGDALKGKWHQAVNVAVNYGTESMTITETPSDGEHFLHGGSFDKSEQVAVHAEVEILDHENVNQFAIYLTSADGDALQIFDLKNLRPGVRVDSGGRVVKSKINETGDGTLILSVTFVLFGSSPTFDLRFQMVSSNGGTIYTGDVERSVMIGKVRLYLVNS